ncbi:magnesium transporter [Natronoglycomyces albus]|uniref:Magnesium transporter MgtE n=1 Tax=Natronoglycomyces albus TaxID=2811108 RepID=A0A895XQE4_9ACTN|nr:magnesium transporter [Natronoglycomyces albus]QSB05932.1 magnesium transporter [Natronoglycomyces albus]
MTTTTTIHQLLTQRDLSQVKDLLTRLPLDSIIVELNELTGTEKALAFRLLEKAQAHLVFEELPRLKKIELLNALAETANVFSSLDSGEMANLLDEAPASVAKKLVAQRTGDKVTQVAATLAYQRGSAGRLANPHYVAVKDVVTAGEALQSVRECDLDPRQVTTVFIIDQQRHYRGLVSVTELVTAEPTTPVSDLARLSQAAVLTCEPAPEAARMLQRYDLGALAVVDSEQRLVGAVTFDDSMDALEDETSETMYRKAGIKDVAHATDMLRSYRLTTGNIWYSVRVRISFLLMTLVGGLLVGGLIEQFEDVLAAVVAVAVFVPLIMDMGGNVGTQSTTIFARGLALGHIRLSSFGKQLRREVTVGMTMALFLGTLGGAIAYLWQGAPNDIPLLGVAVGISLFTSVTLATFLGFALPWLMVKIGLDHAPGADPFITTIKDFTGLFVYFSLVGVLLGVG